MSSDTTYNAYVAPRARSNCLHTIAQCSRLKNAVTVERATESDYANGYWCTVCHTERYSLPPSAVPCQCDDGFARLKPIQLIEAFSGYRQKRAVYYNYRHEGCHVGGTIVYVDGEEYRRIGPLFHPSKYRDVGVSASD